MSIPDYQSLMLPLLKLAADNKEHSLREAIEGLAEQYKLSDEERKEMLPSGQQSILDNRVGWARTYLKKACLLESTRRGYFRITSRGLEVLKSGVKEINVKFLDQFSEFFEFRKVKGKSLDDKEDNGSTEEGQTPGEVLELAYQKMRQDLATDLLQQIKNSSPSFFERLVIDLLVAMGYGGTRKDAGTAIGKTGDGGIDGIIKEDRLGLDAIYVQAKRWENPVGRPDIQKFSGALLGQRAKKGVFLTSSSFTSEAYDYVSRIDNKIVLIDGNMLANLMIDHNVGVSPLAIYELKRIDTDYFTED